MVTVDDISSIKRKIETLKEKKARAEGAMENILRRWKDEYSCSSKEQVEAKIKEMEEQIAEGERRVNVLLEKIDKSYDWSKV